MGGSNTVTVTFSQAAAYPDVRILEYRGVTALDVTAGASGSSATCEQRRGDDDQRQRVDLRGGHGGDDDGGGGERVHVADHHLAGRRDLAEDKIVTTAGSNSATATLTASGSVGHADGDVLGGFRSGADGEQCQSEQRVDRRVARR